MSYPDKETIVINKDYYLGCKTKPEHTIADVIKAKKDAWKEIKYIIVTIPYDYSVYITFENTIKSITGKKIIFTSISFTCNDVEQYIHKPKVEEYTIPDVVTIIPKHTFTESNTRCLKKLTLPYSLCKIDDYNEGLAKIETLIFTNNVVVYRVPDNIKARTNFTRMVNYLYEDK